MGWIQVHENTKVPILKNIAYALKILFKCSKTFMLWQGIAMGSSMLFTNFLQSVLFLKALLSVIEDTILHITQKPCLPLPEFHF